MYKDKPLIIAKRPFWRHPVFPWGWYSLTQDRISPDNSVIFPDGYYKPKDGGGGTLYWDAQENEPYNDWCIIDPVSGTWKKMKG